MRNASYSLVFMDLAVDESLWMSMENSEELFQFGELESDLLLLVIIAHGFELG
jgi:hypothetical protein